MSWLQLKLDTHRNAVEALEDALLDAGAVSVTLQDLEDNPILEPGVGETPLWDNIRLMGLFNADTDTALATVQATAHYGTDLPKHRWEILEDKDWERTWMDNYQPIQCGQRLWICPSWLQPPQQSAVNLMLDPGLAFGTGTHPTTYLCLKWLDGLDLAGKTVVDYGCGSGILGIAALLLGAEKVIAIDNDPQALLATADNGQRNGIDPARLITALPGEQPQLQADVVVANILAAPLIELAEIISGHTRSGGLLCMAGLIDSQQQQVMNAYVDQFDFQPGESQDEWVRLSATKE
ncbi:50S ribosomal protein L11 methyltransferase [Porticoccus sp. GXU_MW_L64]